MTYAPTLPDSQTSLMTFEEFLAWHPEDGCQFELFKGVPQEMPNPVGPHEDVIAFLKLTLGVHLLASKTQWYVANSATVKPGQEETGYKPDVVVLDRSQLADEPLWASASSIVKSGSIPLVVEVVSTNWRSDYDYKFSDYEAMGIQEYWLVDYRALAAARAIGKPKQPTITVCSLTDDGYELARFHRDDLLVSPVLPGLELAVADVFAAAGEG
jgi:Uma2 family endonuclease